MFNLNSKKKAVLAIIISFITYIILNNFFYFLADFFNGNLKFKNSFLFLKGNICFTRNPVNASGFLFFIVLILKFIPAAILYYSNFYKKTFIKPVLMIIIINFYIYDIYSLISFLLQKDFNSDIWLYGFCSAPLFISSYVFFSNYLIIPIISSLLGIFVLLYFIPKLPLKYTYYLIFSILGLFLTIVSFEVLSRYFLG